MLIRGWGAPYLLRSIRHIPRIRICAPLPYRVRRMRELLDFSDDGRVLGEIARSDHAFGSSLRMSKRPNSAEPWHYDVIMNTAQSPVEQCVEAVVKAAGEAQFQETELSRATLANLALRTRILATLKGAPSTAAARIDAVATQGSVMLLGMVGKAEDVRAIGEAVAAIPGVTTLHNELRPIYEGTRSWRSSASI